MIMTQRHWIYIVLTTNFEERFLHAFFLFYLFYDVVIVTIF